MLRKKLKASFTIEASVIVPVILFIIAALMILMFILHDRVIMNTVITYEMMEHARDYQKEPEAAGAAAKSTLDQRLIYVKDVEVAEEDTKEGLTIRSSGNAEIPLTWLQLLLGKKSEQSSVSVNVSNLNGRQTLIKYKTIADGADYLLAPKAEKEEE